MSDRFISKRPLNKGIFCQRVFILVICLITAKLVIESVSFGRVRIRGSATNFYLCVDKRGRLRARVSLQPFLGFKMQKKHTHICLRTTEAFNKRANENTDSVIIGKTSECHVCSGRFWNRNFPIMAVLIMWLNLFSFYVLKTLSRYEQKQKNHPSEYVSLSTLMQVS